MKRIRENIEQEGWDDWKGEVTNWDDPKYADDADWGRNDTQTIDAHGTSRNQLPRTITKMRDHNDWVKGNTNFNMGGGYTDNLQTWLNGKTKGVAGFKSNQQNDIDYGVIDLVFDPFSRDNDYNVETLNKVEAIGGADTVTCNNVLNVIDSKQEIYNVIQRCAEVLKPDGVAYFCTYEGNKDGIGVPTSDGYQQSKKTVKYVPLIHKFFNRVKLSDGVIVAKDPIPQEETANWYTNVDDSLNQTNPRKLNLRRESVQKKKLIRMTENDLHELVKESVKRALKENIFNYSDENNNESELQLGDVNDVTSNKEE